MAGTPPGQVGRHLERARVSGVPDLKRVKRVAPRRKSRCLVQREARRRAVHHTALGIFLGLTVLSGPASGVTPEEWNAKKARAVRGHRRQAYTIETIGATAGTLPRRASGQAPTGRAESQSRNEVPRWGREIFQASDLAKTEKLVAVLRQSYDSSARFCRPSPKEDACGKLSGDSFDTIRPYTVAKAVKDETFRLIVPSALALPGPDNAPVDVRRFLTWPWTVVFSPENMATYRRTPAELAALPSSRPARVCMADGHDEADLYLALLQARMLQFMTLADAPAGPDNGAFAVPKGEDMLRFILAGGPGNDLWSHARVKAKYAEIVAREPLRAAQLNLSPRLMDLPSPAALTGLTPGASGVFLSDYKNFYYGLLQLPEMLCSQRLPPIDGGRVGLTPGVMFCPVMTVCSMGNFLAALLSQIVHLRVVDSLAASPVTLLRPSAQTAARRRDFAKAVKLADKDGFLAVGDVPPQLLQFEGDVATRFGAPVALLPPDLRVPVGTFAYELLPADRVHKAAPVDTVALHTVVLGDCRSLPHKLQQTRATARQTGQAQAVTALSAYIDDEAGFTYEPRAAGQGAAPARAEAPVNALGNITCLLSVCASLSCGLLQSYNKLRWSSAEPGTALGVDFEFLGRGQMEFEVNRAKRKNTAALLLDIARMQAPIVDDELLMTALGKITWELLVRRSFFCSLRVVYKALHSPNKPVGHTYLTPALREELWLAAMLSPCLVQRTAPTFDKLTLFDACGANAHGNGGFGVAQRGGLSALHHAEFTTVIGVADGHLPCFNEPTPGVSPVERALLADHNGPALLCSRLLRFDWDQTHATRRRRTAWKALIQGEFVTPPRHINVAEAVAGRMAAIRSSGVPGARGHNVLIGGDNKSALHALRKGRSSTRDINNICRQVACRAFVRDVTFSWFWVPSASNSSDGPSRWWIDVKKKRAIYCSRAAWLRKFKARHQVGDIER